MKFVPLQVGGITIQIRLRDEEGWLVVDSPDLPGLHTQGRSESEAIENAREAAELLLETRVVSEASCKPITTLAVEQVVVLHAKPVPSIPYETAKSVALPGAIGSLRR